MAGINIPFLSNVRDFLRGTDDVSSALEEVADSLDEVGDGAQDAERTASRSMGDVGDAAEDSAQRLERSFRDSMDAVRADSASTGDAVARNMDEGSSRAADGISEVADEAQGTATEVAASFDGSAESIAGGFQELAANAFAGFGPAGAVAGLAVAAGMGLAMKGMEEAKEEAQELTEGIAETASELIDLEGRERGIEQVTEALKEAVSATEDGTIALLDWADAAETAGIDPGRYMAAMAGDAESLTGALEDVAAEIAATEAERTKLTSTLRTGSAAEDEAIFALEDQLTALEQTKEALTAKQEQETKAAEAVTAYEAALDAATPSLEEQTEALIESQAALRDSASAALEASNAEIGYAATLADTTETIATNGATLDLATDAGRANKSALNDLAAQTLAVADANKVNEAATVASNAKLAEGRTAFVNAAVAAGMAKDAANLLATQYGLVPETITTDISLQGTAKFKTDVDTAVGPRQVAVTPVLETYSLQGALDTAFARLRKPTITPLAQFGTAVK